MFVGGAYVLSDMSLSNLLLQGCVGKRSGATRHAVSHLLADVTKEEGLSNNSAAGCLC